ncbi:MAG: DUF423 domain-containing protein [Actinomycetota bacterium]
MDRAFLVIACVFGFLGVAFGAFGSHALRSRLTPERLGQFEIGVRYQLFHTFAVFAVFFLRAVAPDTTAASVAGIAFIAGVVVFSGSLYALALTGERRWGAVTPIGGVLLLIGWTALTWAALTGPLAMAPRFWGYTA